jgi:hypothetical protein
VLRERLWVRDVAALPGGDVAVGATLMRFTTAPDEPARRRSRARGARVDRRILAQTDAWERQRA